MRCLALAEELVARGHRVILLTKGTGPVLEHAALAGVSQVEMLPDCGDAEAELFHVVSRLKEMKAPVVILDGYAFDLSYQRRIRPFAGTLMCLDDLARDRYDCDLLLNQNLGITENEYAGLLHENTQLLLGPFHALLRRAFLERHDQNPPTQVIKRVLVTIGGADFQDVAVRVVRELMGLPEVLVDLVIGPAYNHPDPLMRLGTEGASRVRVHHNVIRMDRLMEQADLAISGAGSTVWELACLGIPMLLIATRDGQGHDHQYRLGRSVVDAGAAVMLGQADDLQPGRIMAAVEHLRPVEQRERLSRNAMTLVDGRGASRVVDCIERQGRITGKACYAASQDRSQIDRV